MNKMTAKRALELIAKAGSAEAQKVLSHAEATRTVGEAVATLIKRWKLSELPGREKENPNAVLRYRGFVGDAVIDLSIYPGWGEAFLPWAAVQISFGAITGKAQAERGVLHATSEFRFAGETGIAGSALKGHELEGLKWRLSGVRPRSRTACQAIGDTYVQAADIVWHMLARHEELLLP